MRSSFIAAASALIAVAALVAAAGPAITAVPGTNEPIDAATFTRLAGPRIDGATASPTLRGADADGPAAGTEVLLDPGAPPVPSARPLTRQPNAAPRADSKAGPWRTAGYSWYGPGFYGSGTACGQTYTRTILGVAHRTLPCGTRVTFRNPKNGRTITVQVIDRGPYVSGRLWDLSAGTCTYLGNCYTGTIQWRRP